jgi:hypothetical protein
VVTMVTSEPSLPAPGDFSARTGAIRGMADLQRAGCLNYE